MSRESLADQRLDERQQFLRFENKRGCAEGARRFAVRIIGPQHSRTKDADRGKETQLRLRWLHDGDRRRHLSNAAIIIDDS